jgi:hypothetical protein
VLEPHSTLGEGEVDPVSEAAVAEALVLGTIASKLYPDATTDEQVPATSRDLAEHTRRVAAAASAEAKAVAWLHDTVEDGILTLGRIAHHGFSALTVAAVALLTRYNHDGTYAERMATLASLPGDLGRIVRAVKLSDLADNLSHRRISGSPAPRWENAQATLRRAVAERSETDPTA